ncbi:glycosyltransferase family 4 protein [Thermococcus indicus]|uniref:Glycosyltransferase family 4 protein n=1 Tax=Thermococcus indicus TaxID=2586643 RepID=A0A4Y5SJZ9_9EURY|nr:glycosyltransferase family 4 protein [Thermococcus indicus]QDA30479.1 glycosyltransferase family 4 protein [Thermococcus indicus]
MDNSKKRGSLVVFTQTFPPEKGGNASRIGDLYRYLRAFGVNVTVVSAIETYPFGNFPREFKLAKREGNVIRLFTYQPSENASSLERVLYYTIFPVLAVLWLILRRNEVDAVMITSPPPQLYLVALTAKLLKKKVIVDVRDLFLDVSVGLGFIKHGTVVEKLFRFLEYSALNFADAVTVVTPMIRKRLAETYGMNPEKCYIVPNGVDLDLFGCDKPRKYPRMVYAGYFGHAQDFKTFLEAYSRLDEKDRLPIILAGSGETLQDVLAMIEKLGLSGWVRYAGMLPREEVVKLLCSSLIGVAPIKANESLKYAIPSKIYEYLACGLPFVGVGRGEIERVALESKAGCVGENPTEVMACMLKMLDSNLYKASALGRIYVIQYSRESSAKRLLRVLDLIKSSDI